HLQPNGYKDGKLIVRRLRALHAAGKLTALQEKLLFSPTRPAEELYDLRADPHETKDLAADPKYKATLEQLRGRLRKWERETKDQGRSPEPEKMYDSVMAVYLRGRAKNPEKLAELKKNIAQMKAWAKEGK